MAAANDDVAEDRRIILRIGINLGDVMVEGGDLYGDGVNIAARLQALARPGEIWMAGNVHDQVERKLSLTYDDLGPREMKNIARPVHAYRIGADASRAPIPDTSALPTKPSIAVLPFTNLSGDPNQQYFSDGITEDIITELSRFRSLFVIARNSSFQYRDKAVDVRRVARELGVSYVVEGSIRKMAERVRITAQLIDAVTGNHLWSERYDRNIDALFEVQDEVTRTIVATLVGRVEEAEISEATHRRTGSLAAYDSLLRGIELLRGYGDENNRRARELFESSISLDPRFALAHAYLALALLVEHRYDAAPDLIKDRALESGLTAIQLDPREGRCHQFLAQAYRYRGEFDLAISHFERSTALNPNDANGIAQMGSVLAMAGRAEEGVNLIREAMRLNPFHPDWYWSSLAVAAYAAHRYEDALGANRRMASRTAYWPLARAAAWAGRTSTLWRRSLAPRARGCMSCAVGPAGRSSRSGGRGPSVKAQFPAFGREAALQKSRRYRACIRWHAQGWIAGITRGRKRRAAFAALFIDYLCNGRGATAIGPYSPRVRSAFPIAPVSGTTRIERPWQPSLPRRALRG
jgi:adenylate cyclase